MAEGFVPPYPTTAKKSDTKRLYRLHDKKKSVFWGAKPEKDHEIRP